MTDEINVFDKKVQSIHPLYVSNMRILNNETKHVHIVQPTIRSHIFEFFTICLWGYMMIYIFGDRKEYVHMSFSEFDGITTNLKKRSFSRQNGVLSPSFLV